MLETSPLHGAEMTDEAPEIERALEACVADHPLLDPQLVERTLRRAYRRTDGAKVQQFRVLLAERATRRALRSAPSGHPGRT